MDTETRVVVRAITICVFAVIACMSGCDAITTPYEQATIQAKHKAMADAIASGANPIAVGCAFDPSSFTESVCAGAK